jgi:hypothetical protein
MHIPGHVVQGLLLGFGSNTKRGSDILCLSSWWIEKAGLGSGGGRALTSLLRISRDGGGVWNSKTRRTRTVPGADAGVHFKAGRIRSAPEPVSFDACVGCCC